MAIVIRSLGRAISNGESSRLGDGAGSNDSSRMRGLPDIFAI